MQAEDIEAYLAELDQELQQRGIQQTIRILLIGGAFMLTQLHNRPSTSDVDILFQGDVDPMTSPLYPSFKMAVRAVAKRHQMPSNWLNDLVGDFLQGESRIPEGIVWRQYTVLVVSIPPQEYILALKLLAGRQKDRDDIEALCQQLHIQTAHQAQQIIDRYIPNKQLQQVSDVAKTLDSLFP
ncbi:MAG: DUF6036 family nucleotidyltransferase [Chloroflexota bacterium]|nr:DUF6036 family nucleotidyltransferase [Chloroflexota bacterium]